MADFLIVYVDGQIGVGEFKLSGFEVLKCNGELWQEFNPESFWEWFMDKTGLDLGVGHGFVIFSDQEDFTIPAEIRIATSLDLRQEVVQQALVCFGRSVENLNVIAYPNGFQIAEGMLSPQNQQTPQTQDIPQNKLSNNFETCGPILRLCQIMAEEYQKR
ncbi:hypothetical protein NHP200010_04250 [Helicobacter bizzozeronii]|uniref:hypothetical protein n=1 Tax=Helicobacter bizzozeronii TaxID=56877 RepID=UPI00244D8091|nr:hypothetical protein [Helicobacter bizzozeronii]GMB92714.1 hypothetical protein NHP200010_04250 [Helicobacter bizzozeronii]